MYWTLQEFYGAVAEEPISNIVSLVFALVFTVATLIIFFEEVHFVIRHFEIASRRVKTIWVLAIYPVSSVTSLHAGM